MGLPQGGRRTRDGRQVEARHYIGKSEWLEYRLRQHRTGQSRARVVLALVGKGATFKLVRTWEGGRELEVKLKRQKNTPRLCDECRGAHPPQPGGMR